MPKPYDVRLRRYTPGGAAGSILPTLTLDWTAPRSDVPTLKFTAAEAETGVLPDLTEVAVELWDGALWKEPRNGRFFVLARSGDGLDATGTKDYTGVAMTSYMLSKALVVTSDGKDLASSANVGITLGGVFTAAQARGWGASVTKSFTNTTDSAGQAWDTKQTGLEGMTFKPGTSLKAMLQTLADQYVLEYAFTGRRLDVYNSGTGDDLSTGTGRVTVGQAAKELPVITTLEDLATHVTVRGESGATWTYPITGVGESLGRLELSIDAGGITTSAQASQVADLYKVTGAAARHQYTITEPAAAMTARPFVEYKNGDWVSARTPTGWQRMRVVQVQVRRDAEGVVEVDVILEDIMTDLATRIARRSQSLGLTAGGNGRLSAASLAGYNSGSAIKPGTGDTESNYWGTLLVGDSPGRNITMAPNRGTGLPFPRIDFNDLYEGVVSFNNGNTGGLRWKSNGASEAGGVTASILNNAGTLNVAAVEVRFNTKLLALGGLSCESDLTFGVGKTIWFGDGNTKALSSPGMNQLDVHPGIVSFKGDNIQMPGVYARSTTETANVNISSSGTLYRSTSAARYKIDPLASPATEKILEVQPKTWVDLGEFERNGRTAAGLKRVPGVIAEEVAAAGLGQFVIYGEDGQTEGVMYDRLWTELIPVVKAQRDRIDALESRLAALEAKTA